MTEPNEEYIDPNLDMEALEEGQRERILRRSDTDDVDMENERVNRLLSED